MQVVQVTSGRFHHFHLARQMERFGLLDGIWTGYPAFKLRDETGIRLSKIHSFPWAQTLFMAWPRLPLMGGSRRISTALNWLAQDGLDRRVAASLREPRVLVALSGQGEHCGRRAQALGGVHVCDRGSSHIVTQNSLMREEHERWGLPYREIDARVLAKEQREYEAADIITVPSGFAEQSFVANGIDPAKLRRIPYGGRLERFSPWGQPEAGPFRVLFVGHVSLRKGVPYLLEAFGRLRHPNKRLRLIGSIDEEVRPLLGRLPTEGVEFMGLVPNADLPRHYCESHTLVLPSIEEGLAMVMAEAMACGCPVVASDNTGAADLFTDGREGFIVPVRSSEALLRGLQQLADDAALGSALRSRAAARIKAIDGWNGYGEAWRDLVQQVSRSAAAPAALMGA